MCVCVTVIAFIFSVMVSQRHLVDHREKENPGLNWTGCLSVVLSSVLICVPFGSGLQSNACGADQRHLLKWLYLHTSF